MLQYGYKLGAPPTPRARLCPTRRLVRLPDRLRRAAGRRRRLVLLAASLPCGSLRRGRPGGASTRSVARDDRRGLRARHGRRLIAARGDRNAARHSGCGRRRDARRCAGAAPRSRGGCGGRGAR